MDDLRTESVNRMANEMMRAGVAIFIAAGNSAFSAQIGTREIEDAKITVGALDKDTAIAIYSSQGPTEEGRIKPNIAFVGSSVNAPDANTGDGYVALSGTSMATPGAAGVAVLMYRANPDLSPFDIRNIMQAPLTDNVITCWRMSLVPRISYQRIGRITSMAMVMLMHNLRLRKPLNYVYELSMSLNVTLDSEYGVDNHVHIGQGESIVFNLEGGVQRVQWQSRTLRDNWMDSSEFTIGDQQFQVTHDLLVDRLRFLPQQYCRRRPSKHKLGDIRGPSIN